MGKSTTPVTLALPLPFRLPAPDVAKHVDHLLHIRGVGENQSALAGGLDQRSDQLRAGDRKTMFETDIDRDPVKVRYMPVEKYDRDLGPRVSLCNRGAWFVTFCHGAGLYCPNSNNRY